MPLDVTAFPAPASSRALQRIGALAAHGWHAKLYAPMAEAGGLRPEDLAAAARAFRAGIATQAASPVAGFALLRPACDAGGLAFSAFWWEGAALHRAALLLPGCAIPPRRDGAGRIGDVDEVLLMAREAAAWRRCVLDADRPSLDAYRAECCA